MSNETTKSRKVEFAESSGAQPVGLFGARGDVGRESGRRERVDLRLEISRQSQLQMRAHRFAAGQMTETAFGIAVGRAA